MLFNLAEKKLLAYLHAVEGVGQVSLSHWLEWKQKSGRSLDQLWCQGRGVGQFIKRKNALENYQHHRLEYNIDSYWSQLKEKQIRLIFLGDPTYPTLLSKIAQPPVLLYVRAKNQTALDLLAAPLPIAVVGTRRITSYGRYVTRKLTKELIGAGTLIVSGFMYGVDVCAHRAALAAGGRTLAVLGFGFDHIYPPEHRSLFDQFLEKGVLFLSHFPPTTRAAPGNFPARNALVAGLSLGVIVTEAARKSGSHITAQCALDEGRAVLAVPGPIDNPFSQGTKWLLNQGATLVTSGDDVLKELDQRQQWQQTVQPNTLVTNQSFHQSSAPPIKFQSDLEAQIYQLISSESFTSDALAKQLNQPISAITVGLTNLEINGLVKQTGVDWQALKNYERTQG